MVMDNEPSTVFPTFPLTLERRVFSVRLRVGAMGRRSWLKQFSYR